MSGGGERSGCAFFAGFFDASGQIGLACAAGDLAVADVFLDRSQISVMTAPPLPVDGRLADFSGTVSSSADHLAVSNDCAADACAHGDENDVLETPPRAAFPLGEGHAVRIIIDRDGEADFRFEDRLQRDGFPTRNVGKIVNQTLFEIDESGHADADGSDTRVAHPQILDDAHHGLDEIFLALEILRANGRRVVDNMALIDHPRLYRGAAEIDSNG